MDIQSLFIEVCMICFFSLGSNLGDKESNLAKAIEHICRHGQIRFLAKSSIYETEPQGDKNQGWFANQVIAVDYDFSVPLDLAVDNLMNYLLGIEAGMGRVRDENRRFGPRIIDIDILLVENTKISTNLVEVPHPKALDRAFVLVPLHEIAPHITIHNIHIEDALSQLDYRLKENKIYQS